MCSQLRGSAPQHGRCEGRHGNRTHAGRMQHAAEQLDKSPHWRRRQGRDHFYVTTTWSTSRFSFYTGMQQLGRKLACGISGRYKPFPIAGSLKSTTGASHRGGGGTRLGGTKLLEFMSCPAARRPSS